MRVKPAPWWSLPWAASLLMAGCTDDSSPAGPREEEDTTPDIVLVTGTVSTPLGNRVEFVNVRLYGVYGDTLNPSFELLAHDTPTPPAPSRWSTTTAMYTPGSSSTWRSGASPSG